MPSRVAPALAGLLVAAGVSAGTPAARADATEDVRFVYEAPPGCPGESEFVEAVFRDGAAFARAPDGALARTFRVRIAGGDGFTGHLVVRDRTGSEAERTIAGARCEEVARSLAVLVALALQPAPGGEGAAPPPAPAAVPAAPLPPPAPAVAPPTAPSQVAAASEPSEHPSVLESLPPGWRLGASAEATLGGLGSVAPGVAAYVEVIRDVREGFAPALRLGAELAAASVGVPVDEAFGGSTAPVALSRRVARLDACPLRDVMAPPWSSSTLEAWACARLDAGILDVAPDLTQANRAERPWVAAGSLVHLRWVARRLFVDLEGGAVFPLLRERFLVEGATTVYRVPAVTGTGGLALGVYFL